MIAKTATLSERIKARLPHLSPAAASVADYIQHNREQVLFVSASALAREIGTSDATVVRTAKSLGFTGLDDLRQTIADELRQTLSPARRMATTLEAMRGKRDSVLSQVIDIHLESLAGMGREIPEKSFDRAVKLVAEAAHSHVFGIGPSSAMANYLAIQLRRLGLDATTLTQTGLLLADQLQRLKRGDLVAIFAYDRQYRELQVLLDEAQRHDIAVILVSDTLADKLRQKVEVVLPVARGRAGMLSMHTATLALIEALLIAVAARRPEATIASLERLNNIRTALTGHGMDLPTLTSRQFD